MKKSLLLFLIAGATAAFAASTAVPTGVSKFAPDIPGSPNIPGASASASASTSAKPGTPGITPGAPLVPALNPNTLIDVIVRFKTPPTAAMLAQLGPSFQLKRSLNFINGAHVSLSQKDILALQNNPNVLYVTPNRPLKGKLDVTTQTINASAAWNVGWDGTGVGVAVIDSGIALKNDLMSANQSTSRIVYSQNFVSGQTAADLYGHGTHVAGIIGSNGHDSTGAGFSRTIKGVAPNVNLISLRVLDQNGSGQESDVIAAIQAAIQLKNTYNIRVLNLSVGTPVFESYTLDPLCQAVEAAWQAGIVVVAAAGNDGRDNSMGTSGYGTISSPGNDPYVITVGAANTMGTPNPSDDIITTYSSKGPTLLDHIVKPDLVAPGNDMVSLLASPSATLFNTQPQTQILNSYYENSGQLNQVSTTYYQLSGTSMATPVVSAAAALLI